MINSNTLEGTTSSTKAITAIKDWVTVEKFCTEFTNIPEKTIKWQLTMRDRNGLSPHVQVIGKRRYISIQGYAEWLEQRGRCPSKPSNHHPLQGD